MNTGIGEHQHLTRVRQQIRGKVVENFTSYLSVNIKVTKLFKSVKVIVKIAVAPFYGQNFHKYTYTVTNTATHYTC